MLIVKTKQFERWEREFDGGTQQRYAKKVGKLRRELDQLARPEDNQNIVKLHAQATDGTNLYALILDGKSDEKNEVVFAIDRGSDAVVLLGGLEVDSIHSRKNIAHAPERYGKMIDAYRQYADEKAQEKVQGNFTASEVNRATSRPAGRQHQ